MIEHYKIVMIRCCLIFSQVKGYIMKQNNFTNYFLIIMCLLLFVLWLATIVPAAYTSLGWILIGINSVIYGLRETKQKDTKLSVWFIVALLQFFVAYFVFFNMNR